MKCKKYELTNDTIVYDGIVLHRIRARLVIRGFRRRSGQNLQRLWKSQSRSGQKSAKANDSIMLGMITA